MRERARSRRARALTVAAVAAVVLVTGGAVTAYATSRTTAPTYVAASVGSHPVVQTLQVTGTTEPSTAATVSFAVSGAVATVPVAMGDKVSTGQVLATLDTTSLKHTVASAAQQVANAELTLVQAESGQASSAPAAASSKTSSTGTTSTTGTTGSKPSTTGPTKSSGSSHPGSASTAALANAQKHLLGTVRQGDSALATAKTDLALATALCLRETNPSPPPSGVATPTGTPTTSPTATPSGESTPSRTATPRPSRTGTATGASTTCAQAQQLVLAEESHLFTLQQGLSDQEAALDKLLASSAATAGTAPATHTSGSTVGTGSTTVAVSAAQLAADQAAVDAANASLAVAQQQLSQATIVSPLTGVVSSVGLAIGQQATAGSTTAAVNVIDPTGHGVTLSVDVTKIPQVKVGQKATVVPDGSATPLAATVSYVAAAPATTTSTVYTVQLAFAGTPTTLLNGIQAAVTITTAQAANTLAVPTSSVNHRGALDYVLVLDGSTTKRQIITVGAVGAVYTQVTQGLTAGQQVVLANVDQAIPTNTITGRIARITGGVTNTTGVLGGTAGTSRTRPGG